LDDVSDLGDSCEPPTTAKSPNNQGVVTGDSGDAAGNFGSSAYEDAECSLFGDDSSIEDDQKGSRFQDCRYVSAVVVDNRKPAAKPTPVPETKAITRSEQKKEIELMEAVVMDESGPPRNYVQRGPGHPIIDQFGQKGQTHLTGMDRMTNKEVLEWASESTLRWAKRAYAALYPEWLKTIIISKEVDSYWKEYEFRTDNYPDDRIAELIRFRN
jgi:hypothetical protein